MMANPDRLCHRGSEDMRENFQERVSHCSYIDYSIQPISTYQCRTERWTKRWRNRIDFAIRAKCRAKRRVQTGTQCRVQIGTLSWLLCEEWRPRRGFLYRMRFVSNKRVLEG